MRRNGIFWGSLIILIGILFLLDNLGLLPINAGALIWPLALIMAGIWILLGRSRSRSHSVETLTLPIEGASSAEVHIKHGAGKLEIGSRASSGELLSGKFGGGVESDVVRQNESVKVTLKTPSDAVFDLPWNWETTGYSWQLELTPEISLSLILETGASESFLDLEASRVNHLRIKTGASSTRITTPKHTGLTRLEVESGAASVDIRLPEGVAGRIKVKSGLAGISIDTNRFPRMNDIYQSHGYDLSENRADIDIQTGVGSVSIA